MFAFRILVDIALKALSPAINDPTTAVLAIDQIHRLLRMLGKRALRGEVIADSAGAPRLIFRTPNWEDYVHIACNEIRACGGGSMQIMRRMRAMIDNLLLSLPRAPAPVAVARAALPRPDHRRELCPSRRPRARPHRGRAGARRIDGHRPESR